MNAHTIFWFIGKKYSTLARLALLLAILFGFLPHHPAQAQNSLPDLVVTGASEWRSPDGIWYLLVTVRNQGYGLSGSFRFTVTTVAKGRIMADYLTPGLAPGESRTLRSRMTYGCDTYQIVVDSDNRVFESNERNNVRYYTTIC